MAPRPLPQSQNVTPPTSRAPRDNVIFGFMNSVWTRRGDMRAPVDHLPAESAVPCISGNSRHIRLVKCGAVCIDGEQVKPCVGWREIAVVKLVAFECHLNAMGGYRRVIADKLVPHCDSGDEERREKDKSGNSKCDGLFLVRFHGANKD